MIGRINWRPTNRDVRWLGVIIAIGFGFVGAIFFVQDQRSVAKGIWVFASIISVICISLPMAGKPFYFAWMGIAFVLGSIMSKLILLFIFYAIITPVAFFFRRRGRDVLRLQPSNRRQSTYWHEHRRIDDASYYEHLF